MGVGVGGGVGGVGGVGDGEDLAELFHFGVEVFAVVVFDYRVGCSGGCGCC